MKQDTPIRNIINSAKPSKKSNATKYVVCIRHTSSEDEVPEVVARFKCVGDCYIYATALSKAPGPMHEILIRN